MSDQPEALFLADVIENDPQSKAHHDAAAACLRRQHAEIESLKTECDALRAALAANMPAVGMGWIDRAKTAEAEVDALRAELVERNAARNAYASEFPPDHEGKHNVEIILLNIRNLKSERNALLKALVDLMPLAEFGAAEQSPPYADEHLLNAAQTAIDAAKEAGK